jgi:hypothetical protein
MKPLPPLGRLHRVHRQSRDAYNDPLAFRLAFSQPYVGKRGIREHAVRNQPTACAAIPSCQIVTNDAKIVFGYVCELWAAGAFSHCPDVRRTRLQPPIHSSTRLTQIEKQEQHLLDPPECPHVADFRSER